MRRTRIKICGITRAEDAEAACEAGVDALGFVFWAASPRSVSPSVAEAIVRQLPPFVTPVGVFVDEPPDAVNEVAARVGLGVAQLHGDEPVDSWTRIRVPVIKATALAGDSAVDDVLGWPAAVVPLVDVVDPVRRGGTGRTADWNAAARVARRRPLVLAGGLAPANVEAAVRLVRPFAVDVSSGVEQAPGLKDADRIRALVAAVARADAHRE